MRIIKKLIIYTTIIGASLFSILVVFGFIYKDSIVNSVKQEINKHLNAQIKVGKMDLSFVSNFPYASVNLKNVVGFESKAYTANPDTLFVLDNFDLSFNVIDIIDGNYILSEIEGTGGFIHLEINKKGQGNYLIFASNPNDSTKFHLNLNKVKLNSVLVGFNDLRDSDKYKIHFVNTVATGEFTEKEIHTALYGSILVKQLELQNTKYLTNEKAFVDVGFSVDVESNSFQISRGYLTFRENNKFEVKGKSNSKMFHFKFVAPNLLISQTKTLVPQKHLNILKDYQLDGGLNMALEVKRNSSNKHLQISGQFDVRDGSLMYKSTGHSVELNSIQGSFDLGQFASAKSTSIVISQFDLRTKEAITTGSFDINNLDQPKYKIKAKGTADLFEISKLADLGDDFGMQGIASFELIASGKIHKSDTISDEDIKSIVGTANISLSNSLFRIKGLPAIDSVATNILVNEEFVKFSNFSASVAQSKTKGSMELKNWLNYILRKSKRLDMRGSIETQMFDLDDWTDESNTNKEGFSLPEYLSFVGNVKMGTLKANNTILSNVQSTVQYFPRKLVLSNTYFDAFNGRFFTNSSLSQWANGFEIKGDVNTKNVDLHEVLKTYKDFGMTSITHKQIQGDLHSSFEYNLTTNKEFDILNPTILLDGDFMLLNGEIIENSLLTGIPKEVESNRVIALFVNLDLFEKRLHHIKFDTISNHITIKNQVINIPSMTIKSTALNMGVQGTHSFNNHIDYYMNFNLNNVLGKKEPITDEYGFIEDDAQGNRNMYLHVYSKNGEIEVDVDKYGSKKIFNLGNSEEMKTAKSILKEELGLFKKDSTVVVEESEEVFDYQIDLGEFSDTVPIYEDTTSITDTVQSDSSVFGKLLKKKKKKKKKEDNFEEWDVEDEDF
ncbi:MAG: AsmA-like C-terminal region-containing protein [Salibacteraceae bacterium]